MKKKFLLFIIIFFIFGLLNISSEENSEGKIIHKIIFKGIKKAKKKDVLTAISTKEKTPLNLTVIENDYQNLIALDYFDDVAISTGPAYDENTKQQLPDNIDLVFDFIEKPTIRKIIFKGNQSIGYGFLINDITVKKFEFLKKSSIITDINTIKDKYQKKGFSYVDVKYEVFQNEELKSKGQVDLIFNITEGMETYVKDIIIKGNIKLSEFTLKNKMKTKEKKYLGLQKGVFVESEFYQDIEDLKKYYRDQGFYFVEIMEPEITKYEVVENEIKKETIKIVIQIKEGSQYRYGGLKIEGNNLFSYDDLTYNLKLRKTNMFNYSRYQEDKFAIQKKYTDAGYVQTIIEDQPVVDEENKIISFNMKITESKRSYIEGVYFKGNTKTKNYVLYRAIVTEAGQIFDSSRLMASIMGLYNLGFFSKVEYDIQQGSSSGLLKITYLLEEQSTAELRFGLQVTTSKWPPDLTLFGEISEKNFLGRELSASAKVDASLYKQGFEVRIEDPWFLSYPWSLGTSFKFYHEWTKTVLKKLTSSDYARYFSENTGVSSTTEDTVRDYFYDRDLDEWLDPNYFDIDGSWAGLGVHNLTWEYSISAGYRFLKYFGVSSELSVTPIYTFLNLKKDTDDEIAYYKQKVDEIYLKSYRDSLLNNNGWSVKSKFATSFSISTTKERINPTEGIKFSVTGAYTFGSYDSVGLSSKFTAYLKTLDISFNDWAFRNVLVFNAASSFIFPGFQNLAGEKAGKGPILYSSDYLTVDGLFVGRGWGNSLGATSTTDRLTSKVGYARFDYSLEYRIPIHEKFIWFAAFIDMVNLVEGPRRKVQTQDQYGNIYANSYSYDDSYAWMWWNQLKANKDGFNYEMSNWYGIENWYGSIGVGFELTIQQLPLSFYIVKRFKINSNLGFEWIHENNSSTGDLDFVLSIVGYYF
jgi:outer membrane protein assembly complex protein YaeT